MLENVEKYLVLTKKMRFCQKLGKIHLHIFFNRGANHC